MNHGYCKNCWWWKRFSGDEKDTPANPDLGVLYLVLQPSYGRCWMQIGDGELVRMTHEKNYCLDYVNRKKEEKKSGTLEDWVKTLD